MDIRDSSDFLFSSKFRVWRHVLFWLGDLLFFSVLVNFQGADNRSSYGQNVIATLLMMPARMLSCYLLIYWLIPGFLLKGRHLQFSILMVASGVAYFFFNILYRAYIFIPLQDALHFRNFNRNPWQPGSYYSMLVTASGGGIIALFKHWMKKQQEWMQAEKDRVTAELQMLKAQVHPHFLFNTLNNIYSFSLENSAKTPGMILKLSSLLSYMLYDCKAEQVWLEKELEVMKDYIDLERERYANNIEVSLNMEGDIKGPLIAPLLLLPFLENAFKHGTSEQLEKPWLSMDLAVKGNTMKCKIANSKNEFVPVRQNGIGIENVRKRLQFLYPGKHDLKLSDEGDFFVVSLWMELVPLKMEYTTAAVQTLPAAEKTQV